MKKKNISGFTLVETVAAITILVMAVAMALSGYLFLMKRVNQADTQDELDIDAQMAIEWIKHDMRLSSMSKMLFYPEGAPPYTAVSFPMAYPDAGGNGLIERDTEGMIIWDETIIYHIRPGTPHELVRTVFSPRDETLTDGARQDQLDAVVAAGNGSGVANGDAASSKAIFANMVNWALNPRNSIFSAYAENPSREEITMGYALLTPGAHTFTFTAIGSSPNGDFNIGIDQFMAAPSYLYREAEDQNILSEIGASTAIRYNPTYGNLHELFFPATQSNHSFTIEMNNDLWKETNFGGRYSGTDQTEVYTDPDLNDIVIKLAGNNKTWDVESQTGDYSGGHGSSNMNNHVVRIMLKGSTLNSGNFLKENGERCRLTFAASPTEELRVSYVRFGESINPETTEMTFNCGANFDSTNEVEFAGNDFIDIPAGGARTSDWIDIPINTEKNYIVSYGIDEATKDSPRIWDDNLAYNAGFQRTTQIAHSTNGTPLTTIADTPHWGTGLGLVRTNVYSGIGLKSVNVSYVDKGTYTSDIIDTHLENPPGSSDISWEDIFSAGTSLDFKFRTGDQPDLSDAAAFTNIAHFSFSRSVPIDRYIQWQALMESDTPDHLNTPVLKDVTVQWTGERRMTNIKGNFSKGPNFGTFELRVDNKLLQSALNIDLEIYKDVIGINNTRRKVTSSTKVEITPRNSEL